MQLQWQPSFSDGNSLVKHYIVAIKEPGKDEFKHVQKVPGDLTTCCVTQGLEQGKNYVVRIYAENDVRR